MAAPRRQPSLLRARKPGEHGKVTYIELFFDLVFVFAITQLSLSLQKDPSPLGLAHVVLLLLAIWWVWIDTCWATNWLDPERSPVALLLVWLMLTGLILAAALPQAFAQHGLVFGVVYAATQLGRCCFMLAALRRHSRGNFRNYQRITIWRGLAGLLWVAGGLAQGPARMAVWACALIADSLSPWLGFWVPGLGRSRTEDCTVEGGHMAERCALFVIIALGESILVTGAGFAALPWQDESITAFLVAFLGNAALWWIYFGTGAERGSRAISSSGDPGRLARFAYTYLHLPIVAGVITTAAADNLILAHPHSIGEPQVTAVILGGPAVYVLGNALFKQSIFNRFPLSHLVGLALLFGLLPVVQDLSALALGATVTVILLTVAIWERISWRHSRRSALEIG
jgi:low temperature requirement protein LtrA